MSDCKKWDGAASVNHDPDCEVLQTHARVVVWQAMTHDQAWEIDVTTLETNPFRGELVVKRVENDEEILREEVPVSDGSPLNHQHDVNLWGEMALGAIDHYNAQHTMEGKT
jgi:hypothetical protein